MILKIINYGVRGIIVLIGILLLSGAFMPPDLDTTFMNVMGIVFILFGIYRIVTYYSFSKRYERYEKLSKEDDDE